MRSLSNIIAIEVSIIEDDSVYMWNIDFEESLLVLMNNYNIKMIR